jgi:hypothetical protein
MTRRPVLFLPSHEDVMRRILAWTGFLLALVLAGPAPAQNKAPEKATPQEYSALTQAGTVTGRVKSLNGTDKSLTLELDVPAPQANRGAATEQARQQEHIAQAEADILRTRDPVQRAQKAARLQAELQRDQVHDAERAAHPQMMHKDYDLDAANDVKVRRQDPPVQYDDKGNVKKYTSKELSELKGDSKLPGYAADWTDLKVGQTIKISVVAPKKDKDAKDKDAKDKDKADTTPKVSQVMIVKEAPENADQGGKKK